MNRSKSFAKNAMWSLLLQATNIIVAFVVPHAIISLYGSEVNGLIAALTQMVSYISLVEAGISSAAIFALYNPLSKQDWKQVGIIVSAAKCFYYKSGVIFVAISIALAVVYPLFLDCAGLDSLQIALIVVSLCATGFLDFFTLAKYRVLLTADQHNWVIQIATIIYKVLYAFAIVGMTAIGISVEMVFLAAIVPIVIRTAILVLYAKRKYSFIDFNAKHNGYNLDQRWDAFYLQILGAVQNGFPILVATFVVGDLNIVSVYAVYMLVANGVQQICATVTNGTQAAFGDVIARKDDSTLKLTYAEMGSMMGIIGSAAAGTTSIMIVPFVLLYVSGIADVNYSAPLLGLLVASNVFFYHLKTPEGLLVIAAGKYRESRPYVTVQSFLLIIGSVLGALVGGIEGMTIGVCISNIYAAIYLNFFIPKRVTQTRKRETLKRYIVSCLAFAPALIISSLQLIKCSTWLIWISECMGVAALFTAYSFLVFLLFERESTLRLLKRAVRIVSGQ